MVKTLAAKKGIDLSTIKPREGPYAVRLDGPAPVLRTINGETVETFAPGLYDCPICANRGAVVWIDAQRGKHFRSCGCIPVRKQLVALRKDGTLDPSLYHCQRCGDSGAIIQVDRNGRRRCALCDCIRVRSSLASLKHSGLGEKALGYTFDRYQVKSQWHETAKRMAMAFSERDRGWMFYSGRTGTGKTHLCVAACQRLIQRGLSVRYLTWIRDGGNAKRSVNDPETYNALVRPWIDSQVLYIDDLFKTEKSTQPTPGDVRLAYEIINSRYMSPEKMTVISSELQLGQILNIDEAIGGRILEMAKPFILDSSERENWRLQ